MRSETAENEVEWFMQKRNYYNRTVQNLHLHFVRWKSYKTHFDLWINNDLFH